MISAILRENIQIAVRSIRTQMLRTILTILIIAFGIMALVGILTAIDGIKSALNQNFASMGASSFNIKNRGDNIHFGGGGKAPKRYRAITLFEAESFAQQFNFPATKRNAQNNKGKLGNRN